MRTPVRFAGLTIAVAVVVVAPDDPNWSVSSPVMPFDPGYWTPERMANAKPMPMPTPK